MSERIFLKCGCAANSMMTRAGAIEAKPGCAIHDCDEPAKHPDLTGRSARCGCGNTAPSAPDLPFFEFCGEGSREAIEVCKCGFNMVAHSKSHFRCKAGGFASRGPLDDRYYCGHSGWD